MSDWGPDVCPSCPGLPFQHGSGRIDSIDAPVGRAPIDCDKVRAFHRACFSGEQELQIQRTKTPFCPRHARNFGVGNTLGSLMSNGHIMSPPPEVLASCQAQLGEGPVWVPAEQALYWVDIKGTL